MKSENRGKDRPILSTIVLNWNRAHLLRITLESYLASVSVPYELIVVDNASTDSSADVIDEVCRRSERHRAVRLKRNLGGPALNAGLRLAKGEFLHMAMQPVATYAGEPTIFAVANAGTGGLIIGSEGRPEWRVPRDMLFVFAQSYPRFSYSESRSDRSAIGPP